MHKDIHPSSKAQCYMSGDEASAGSFFSLVSDWLKLLLAIATAAVAVQCGSVGTNLCPNASLA